MFETKQVTYQAPSAAVQIGSAGSVTAAATILQWYLSSKGVAVPAEVFTAGVVLLSWLAGKFST